MLDVRVTPPSNASLVRWARIVHSLVVAVHSTVVNTRYLSQSTESNILKYKEITVACRTNLLRRRKQKVRQTSNNCHIFATTIDNLLLNTVLAYVDSKGVGRHRQGGPWPPPGPKILSFWPLKRSTIRVEPPPLEIEKCLGALPWKNSCLRPW